MYKQTSKHLIGVMFDHNAEALVYMAGAGIALGVLALIFYASYLVYEWLRPPYDELDVAVAEGQKGDRWEEEYEAEYADFN